MWSSERVDRSVEFLEDGSECGVLRGWFGVWSSEGEVPSAEFLDSLPAGGGPYARAIDSVSQSGTAKRLSKCLCYHTCLS